MLAKRKQTLDDVESTLDALCRTLRFRSKQPKVIDLTDENNEAALGMVEGTVDLSNMPKTLTEQLARCKTEEKDLYLYYYLQQKRGESIIIFCNAITATRRLSSLLEFLKIKNFALHSKMQQRQRLKNLDRFKRAVT